MSLSPYQEGCGLAMKASMCSSLIDSAYCGNTIARNAGNGWISCLAGGRPPHYPTAEPSIPRGGSKMVDTAACGGDSWDGGLQHSQDSGTVVVRFSASEHSKTSYALSSQGPIHSLLIISPRAVAWSQGIINSDTLKALCWELFTKSDLNLGLNLSTKYSKG